MTQTTTLALVGPGRAGLTVTSALVATGVRPVAVPGRSPAAESTRAALVSMPSPEACPERLAGTPFESLLR